MILFFDLIIIIAAALGLYYLLGTEWKHMNEYRRADAVKACTFLVTIATLALIASFVGPFR